MSTMTGESQRAAGTPASLSHSLPARQRWFWWRLELSTSSGALRTWRSALGSNRFRRSILAGLRHLTVWPLPYPIFRRTTGIKPTAAHWRTAVVAGALLLFVGNGGVSWAELTVPSGIAALLVATVSLWLVIVDWLRREAFDLFQGWLWDW